MPIPIDPSADATVASDHGAAAAAFDHGQFAPGDILADRYRIVGLLGRGGMGEVYRADDLTLGQSVALKFLPWQVDRDPRSLERLMSEVRTARQVTHPSVCRVHDVGEAAGRRFISMEYVDGEDLSVLLRRIGRLPADKGLEIARQICAGLAASHDRGVLHRDLKPANIMIDGRGQVRITDFGLATAYHGEIRPGEFAGTPAYMAPELLGGEPASVQSDIYALGLVLFEIFTGRRFHDVGSVAELRDRHADTSAVELSASHDTIDPVVGRVIERCLEADPRRRPVSCAQVSAMLPGGDPIAAALAAGETPSPQMVAASGDTGALAPRTAVVLGVLFVGALGWLAFGGGPRRGTEPREFGVTRSIETLSSQTRDLLAGLGYTGEPVDRAAGFSYRYEEWRDPALLAAPHPRALLKPRRPAPVFFWYREHPDTMVPELTGRIGIGRLANVVRGVDGISPLNPPLQPGSAYVERAPDGSLDTLIVVPGDANPRAARADMGWDALFEAARLDSGAFRPSPPNPAFTLPGDTRLAWEGTGEAGEAVRIEAAAASGRPVAFRVLSRRTGITLGSYQYSRAAGGSGPAPEAINRAAIAFLFLSYGAAGFFIYRNLELGRGDRRGALRLARVLAVMAFVSAMLTAGVKMAPSLSGTLNGAAAMALFAGAWSWGYYIAIEPFARRRWPRSLIGWSRLLAGEWRDPRVGREVFVGMAVACAAALLDEGAIAGAARLGHGAYLIEDFHFESLSGVSAVIAAILQAVVWAVGVGLLWVVLLLVLRRLLRHDVAAVAALAVLSSALAPSGFWLFLLMITLTNALLLALMIRQGFLALVSAIIGWNLMTGLPFTPGDAGFLGSLSMLTLAVVAVPALSGLYNALAGQSIFALDADA